MRVLPRASCGAGWKRGVLFRLELSQALANGPRGYLNSEVRQDPLDFLLGNFTSMLSPGPSKGGAWISIGPIGEVLGIRVDLRMSFHEPMVSDSVTS